VSLILYAPFADRELEELHQIGPSTTAAAPPLRMRSLKEEEPPLGSTMEEHGLSSWSFEPACELRAWSAAVWTAGGGGWGLGGGWMSDWRVVEWCGGPIGTKNNVFCCIFCVLEDTEPRCGWGIEDMQVM
jgi:hypothetical protein